MIMNMGRHMVMLEWVLIARLTMHLGSVFYL